MSAATLTGSLFLVLLVFAFAPHRVGPSDQVRPDVAAATRILARVAERHRELGPDVLLARNRLEIALSATLVGEARVLAARGQLLAALARYAQADDVARPAYWRTVGDDGEANRALGRLVLDLLFESDLVATHVFTRDFVERQRWRNFLAERSTWTISVPGDVDGKVTFAGPALRVEMPEPDGVVQVSWLSVAAKQALRDVVIDLQVTVEVVGFTLYLRRDPGFDIGDVQRIDFTCNDEHSSPTVLAKGRTHDVLISLIGSELRVRSATDDHDQLTRAEKVKNFRPRAGDIQFLVRSGARFTITRFRIKDLRGG